MPILDASAVLASLLDEPGGAKVEAMFHNGIITAVNWSEIAQKVAGIGLHPNAVFEGLCGFGVSFCEVDIELANVAAALFPYTRPFGLSLGDRCCIAKGLLDNDVVVTADQAWLALDCGAKIESIR